MNVVSKFKSNPARFLEFVLLSVGIASLPIYISKSGGIQPAHFILALFAGLYLLRKGLPRTSWVALLLALAVYVLIVEMSYSIHGKTYSINGKTFVPMINGAFFLYNFVVTAAVFGFCRRWGLSAVSIGLVCATLIAVGTVVMTGVDLQDTSAYGRSTGSFNNPNQLGFFSVCLLSVTYLLYRQGQLSYTISVGLFVAALFLSVASLSRAAIFSNMVVFFFALKPTVSRSALMLWGVATAVTIALLWWLFTQGALDDFAFVRRFVESSAEQDASLEGRGYFAFTHGDSVQLFFGHGAETVHKVVGHEVHSTIVSVLSSYGLIGLTLFVAVLIVWGQKLWSRYGVVGLVCIAGPAMMYGVTHNGTRFTFFWLLFAASLAMASRGLDQWDSMPRSEDQLSALRKMPS